MAFLFNVLFDKLDANKLSLLVVAEDAFDNVDVGVRTDANCRRDCRSIDFDEKPKVESSLILANGLFLIWSEIFKTLSSSEKKIIDYIKNNQLEIPCQNLWFYYSPSFLFESLVSGSFSNFELFFLPNPFLQFIDFESSVDRLLGFTTRLGCALRFEN